ncbi:MAG: hypothetical protein WEB58_14450 [Planctomycetaceae bacterium]
MVHRNLVKHGHEPWQAHEFTREAILAASHVIHENPVAPTTDAIDVASLSIVNYPLSITPLPFKPGIPPELMD